MTRTFAVLGRPVAHSLSPRIHGAWLAEHGVDGVYGAIEVPEGRDALVPDAVRTLRLAGANLTAPLKEVVVPGLDALEGDALLARAVNVLAWDGARLVGANTDAEGFVRALPLDPAGVDAVVLGAGGAARAVVVGLARHGAARIRVLARRPEAARAVVEALSAAFPRATLASGSLADAGAADLVVDATSGGEHGVRIVPRVWADLAYGPPRPALSAARAAGAVAVDGLGMLVWQAALAFERWTGARPDPLPMLVRLGAEAHGRRST